MAISIDLIVGLGKGGIVAIFVGSGTSKLLPVFLSPARIREHVSTAQGFQDIFFGALLFAAACTAVFTNYPSFLVALALLAAAVGIGGLARALLYNDQRCLCFGVLSVPLERWILQIRLVLIASSFTLGFGLWIEPTASNLSDLYLGERISIIVALGCVMLMWAKYVVAIPASVRSVKYIVEELVDFDLATVLGTGVDGRPISIHDLPELPEKLLIVYLSQGCRPCASLASFLSKRVGDLTEPKIVVVTDSTPSPYPVGDCLLLHDDQRSLYDHIKPLGTPFAIMLERKTGKLSEPIRYGIEPILSLIKN